MRETEWIMADKDKDGMDIRAQEKTFDGFVGFTIKAVVIILVLIAIMALANA